MLSSPVDVILSEGNTREIVQPDVLFISHKRASIVVEEEIRGAPDLAVEVLSPGTETRDRTYKKHLYGRYGVREYWIIEPVLQTLEVHQSTGSSFDVPTIYQATEALNSPLFPGLDIRLSEVFDFS